MPTELHYRLRDLSNHLDTFILATVVAVRGSSSAKPGAKAIIHPDGRNLWGWVGGGCAESFIIEQALEALEEGQPRVVEVDLDDELLGVGMPCGGYMDVYLEPITPPKQLFLLGDDARMRLLCALANIAGYAVTAIAPHINAAHYPTASNVLSKKVEDAVLPENAVVVTTEDAPLWDLRSEDPLHRALGTLAGLIAQEHGQDGSSMSLNKHEAGKADGKPELLIIGRSRISEELARMGCQLQWPTTVNAPELDAHDYPKQVKLVTDDLGFDLEGAGPQTYVVIASQHKGDHSAALNALKLKVPYIGLIASRKRAGLVLDWLKEQGVEGEASRPLQAPAGLNLGAVTPFHIALSIICQILTHHNES